MFHICSRRSSGDKPPPDPQGQRGWRAPTARHGIPPSRLPSPDDGARPCRPHHMVRVGLSCTSGSGQVNGAGPPAVSLLGRLGRRDAGSKLHWRAGQGGWAPDSLFPHSFLAGSRRGRHSLLATLRTLAQRGWPALLPRRQLAHGQGARRRGSRHQHGVLRLRKELGIVEREVQPPALAPPQRRFDDQARRLMKVAQFD